MCGIAGFVGTRPEDTLDRLNRMSRALVHRGPDESGLLTEGEAGLTIRRLAIVGVHNGWQPIQSEDGTLAIVGNGEIYNAPQLRRELEERGHRFRGGSDIEVALHQFEEDGVDFLHRLNGMFALAILDRPSGRVLVARDRIGIKPLFYAETSRGALFASELPALRCALNDGDGPLLALDNTALHEYLRLGYVPAPRTLHRGIRQLAPGERMWIDERGCRRERWWQLPELVPEDRPVDEWADELVALLQSSVRLRTLGDVSPGVLLSGGLDSGTLAGLLARSTSSPLHAFTIAVDDPQLDEMADAARTARHFGLTHVTERLSGVSVEELDDLFEHLGEPFADVSLLPTDRVARLAARHNKFVIAGDGGDELFAGYSWLLREVQLRSLPAPLRTISRWLAPVLAPGQLSLRADRAGQALRYLGDLASPIARSFIRRRSLCPPTLLDALVADHLREHGGVRFSCVLERHAAAWHGSPLALCLDLDRRFSLAGDILTKVDRATMRHSLEARVPFLDHRIVELAARIPVATHLGADGRGKRVLRRAIERLLPPELLSRGKRGFGLPVDRWLRGPLADGARERLLDRGFLESGAVDPRGVARVLDLHASGAANLGHLIWGLLSLASCLRSSKADAIAPTPSRIPSAVSGAVRSV